MGDPARASILCVDDEPNVLEGLKRHLQRRFEVVTCTDPAAALVEVKREIPFTIVISDMRMPGMDGAAFLSRVREISPDSVRILLTGGSDLNAAVQAINEGRIFRFLSKPCPPGVLIVAVTDALEQYRLITAERVLLEQTLHGSIKALTDILAIANPLAFGRGTRIKRYVGELADLLGMREKWQAEVAAMLSQIGCITLPPKTVERLHRGEALSEDEQAMVKRVPDISCQLLAQIPRLELVREILAYQQKQFDGAGPPDKGVRGAEIPWGARALKVAMDFDSLETQGMSRKFALDLMQGRQGWYDPEILQALERLCGLAHEMALVREFSIKELYRGLFLSQDVVTPTGMVLIARGQEVTTGILERLRNFAQTTGVCEPIRVTLPHQSSEENEGPVGSTAPTLVPGETRDAA